MSTFNLSRRTVLQAGAAGVVAATAGGALLAHQTGPQATGQPLPENLTFPDSPPQPRSADSIGIAIIGLGDYALRQMMPRFAQARRAHVAGLVSGNSDKLRTVGDAYGVPESARYSYATMKRMADNPDIDAVYIVLPTGLHAEYAERAFAAGKHVLCEKPMAITSAECERMIAAARRADRKLMIAYRCHFEPYNLKAMDLTANGAVGDLRMIRTNQTYRMGPTDPASNWRVNAALAGGGPLEDYGLYGLQSALYLSGEMPTSVSATTYQPAGDPRFAEIFASTSTQLAFPSGAQAQLFASYDADHSNFTEARGTIGTMTMDPATGYGGNTLSVSGENAQDYDLGSSEGQFAAQLDHLADAIRDGTALRTPGEMGLRDIRLVEAIYASAREGRTIMLNPDGTMRNG